MRKSFLWFLALFSAISLHGISVSSAQDAPNLVGEVPSPNLPPTPNIAWIGGGMWSQTAVAQSPDGQFLAACSASGDDKCSPRAVGSPSGYGGSRMAL